MQTYSTLRKVYEVIGYVAEGFVQCVDCTHHLYTDDPIFLDDIEDGDTVLCDVCGEDLAI